MPGRVAGRAVHPLKGLFHQPLHRLCLCSLNFSEEEGFLFEFLFYVNYSKLQSLQSNNLGALLDVGMLRLF